MFARRALTTTLALGGLGCVLTVPLVPAAKADADMTDVQPAIAVLSGGGSSATYELPGGQTMVIRTPPAGFDPASATTAALREYGFPVRPSSPAELAEWQNAMDAYTSSPAPPGTISSPSEPTTASTYYDSNWAGFTAGQSDSQSDAFVAVQADVTVPTTSPVTGSTYCYGSGQILFAWIGLGGTNGGNNLVQQGVECNDHPSSGSNLPDTAGFHPFHEFADTRLPQELCGSGTGIGGGKTLYEEESYETSDNTAFFFMEDVDTGAVIGSCSVSAPTSLGWSFDGNTADYVVEANTGGAPLEFSFSTIRFGDGQLEWGSDGDWVGFGTRPTTKYYDGKSSTNYCAGPSTIGSDDESFGVSYSGGDCNDV